jgi:hypothetical protein
MQRDTYLMLTRDATVLNFAQWSLTWTRFQLVEFAPRSFSRQIVNGSTQRQCGIAASTVKSNKDTLNTWLSQLMPPVRGRELLCVFS